MSNSTHYDYIIIGCGVAGLHLAYQISKEPVLQDKTVAILDSNIYPKKDRILSFWEEGIGLWDSLIFKKWKKTKFENLQSSLKINLTPYIYKSLKFKDFFSFCIKHIVANKNVTLIEKTVHSVSESDEGAVVMCNSNTYTSTYVFDSRISSNFIENKQNYPLVVQSFQGWEIKADAPIFDASFFTMMDYRYQFKDSNSFMYILPISNTKALIEYTFFAPFLISSKEFEDLLVGYMLKFFPGITYTLINKEDGEIPMSSYNFKSESTTRVKKIGTAGGWVKASTGYSFKFSEKNAKSIASQLQRGIAPVGYRSSKRFAFYDRLFIKVLQSQNSVGPSIFYEMYRKVPPSVLFSFLDEETTLVQEIKLILKLPFRPFIKALLKKHTP